MFITTYGRSARKLSTPSGFVPHILKKNEILRAATASDAAQILTETDAVLRERGQQTEFDCPANAACADETFAHMAAYMEAPA